LLVTVQNLRTACMARLQRKKPELEKKKHAKEAADSAQKEEQRQQIEEKVALQEHEELVKKQHEAQNILKTSEGLLTDGNAKLTAALQTKDFQMASVAQAIIEAGQKTVRLQDNNWSTMNLRKRLLITNENDELHQPVNLIIRNIRVPVQYVGVNVAAVSNT